MKDEFEFDPHFNSTLFKQGTELVAMQRGNLEMCNLAPADISKQVPSWSLLTSAYLFRDSDHLKKTFKSDVGQEMIKEVRDKLGIQLVAPVYFGTRQVNLKPNKKINTPADLAGMKLRMPPGEFWQFLGESIGANPTPVAFAEVYTALQTGAIDGQDNPAGAEQDHEVLRGHHAVRVDRPCHRLRHVRLLGQGVGRAEARAAAKLAAAAEKAFDACTAKYNAQEKEAVDFFKEQRLQVYTPDVAALPRPSPRRSTSTRRWPRTGRRACSSASTPSSEAARRVCAGHARAWLRRQAEHVAVALLLW